MECRHNLLDFPGGRDLLTTSGQPETGQSIGRTKTLGYWVSASPWADVGCDPLAVASDGRIGAIGPMESWRRVEFLQRTHLGPTAMESRSNAQWS
jgi:hypothetical protein